MEIWAYIVYYTWTETLALNCHLIVRKCWSFFVFFFVLNFGEDFYAAFWLKICLDQDCAKTGKSTQPLDRLFKMTSAKAAHSQFIHCLSEQFDMCKMCLFMIQLCSLFSACRHNLWAQERLECLNIGAWAVQLCFLPLIDIRWWK